MDDKRYLVLVNPRGVVAAGCGPRWPALIWATVVPPGSARWPSWPSAATAARGNAALLSPIRGGPLTNVFAKRQPGRGGGGGAVLGGVGR